MSLSVSSVISSVNLNSPLPSLFELVVSRHLETGLFNFFKYAHMTLSGRSAWVARTGHFSNELYLLLMLVLQKHLLWESETTFCELVMGLVQSGVSEKPGAAYYRLPFFGRQRGILPPWLFGPPPFLSSEERMLLPFPLQSAPVVEVQGSGAGGEVLNNDGATGVGGVDTAGMTAGSSLSPEEALMSSGPERMIAERSLYGHLPFTRLSKVQKVVSLLMITVVPYLLRRAEAWHGEQVDPTPDAVAAREAFARAHPQKAKVYAFLAAYVYPVLHVGWWSLHFLFNLFYALELTPYTTPINRLAHIAVRRLQASDSAVSPKAARLLLFVRVTMMLLHYSTLFVQWTTREQNRYGGTPAGGAMKAIDRELQNMPIPLPPVFGVDTNLPPDATPPTPGECPVCHKEIVNTTVLTASGILGCYVCLHDYVQEHRKCPVTRQSAALQQLRRVVKS